MTHQLSMLAQNLYYEVLVVLYEMLHMYGLKLGLMLPGVPEQLAVNNGATVASNGQPLFIVSVRAQGPIKSFMSFGRTVQQALDCTAYRYCTNRICLLKVGPLPNGTVGLLLTVEGTRWTV